MDRLKVTLANVTETCGNKTASLLGFESREEYDFITDVLDRNHWQQTGVRFWIRAKRVGKSKAFSWEFDNSPVHLAIRDDDYDGTAGSRDCLQLFRDKKTNNWAYEAENCDEQDQDGSFICEKPANIE